VVYKNSQISATSQKPSFGQLSILSLIPNINIQTVADWFDFGVNLSDQYFQRMTAHARASDIYLELGNTGTAVQRKWVGTVMSGSVPPHLDTPAIQKIFPKSKKDENHHLRHPDPTLVPKLNLKDERLQVRGSWKKIELQKGGGLSSRMGFASFVYKGDINPAPRLDYAR
jgi:hypothetical protein